MIVRLAWNLSYTDMHFSVCLISKMAACSYQSTPCWTLILELSTSHLGYTPNSCPSFADHFNLDGNILLSCHFQHQLVSFLEPIVITNDRKDVVLLLPPSISHFIHCKRFPSFHCPFSMPIALSRNSTICKDNIGYPDLFFPPVSATPYCKPQNN